MNRLLGAIQRDGVTVVPLAIYFNERGRAKVELGLAHGKRKADKRQSRDATATGSAAAPRLTALRASLYWRFMPADRAALPGWRAPLRTSPAVSLPVLVLSREQ